MRYLLDTNCVSDMMHNPQGKILGHLSRVGEKDVFTSIIVVAEIRYGIEKRGSKKLAARLDQVLGVLPVERFEAPADERYGWLRHETKKAGKSVGSMDMLIAAHALALDATLVTGNERELSYVPGLKIENWLK